MREAGDNLRLAMFSGEQLVDERRYVIRGRYMAAVVDVATLMCLFFIQCGDRVSDLRLLNHGGHVCLSIQPGSVGPPAKSEAAEKIH